MHALVLGLRAADELLLETGFNAELSEIMESGNFAMAEVLADVQRLADDLHTVPTTPRFFNYRDAKVAEAKAVLKKVLDREEAMN